MAPVTEDVTGALDSHPDRVDMRVLRGVDGIISQDPLGLDRIHVQAKRYALDQDGAAARPSRASWGR